MRGAQKRILRDKTASSTIPSVNGVFGGESIITSGLVLNLDGNNYTSGTTWTDTSGQDNNGTINGATYDSGNGGYFVFDGTNDHIDCGSVSDTNFGTGDFAVECWFFDDGNTAGYAGLVVNGQSGGGDNTAFQLGKRGLSGTTNRVDFARGHNTSFSIFDSTNTIQANTWTHAIATRIGTTVKLYVNGVEVASGTDSGSYSNTALRVGVNRGGNVYWSGKISNVKLYKGKGFSASDVQHNFDAMKGRYLDQPLTLSGVLLTQS